METRHRSPTGRGARLRPERLRVRISPMLPTTAHTVRVITCVQSGVPSNRCFAAEQIFVVGLYEPKSAQSASQRSIPVHCVDQIHSRRPSEIFSTEVTESTEKTQSLGTPLRSWPPCSLWFDTCLPSQSSLGLPTQRSRRRGTRPTAEHLNTERALFLTAACKVAVKKS